MTIKVLSGILVTRGHPTGRARLDLDTNQLVEGPTGMRAEKATMVGSGRYRKPPCRMVAIREATITVHHPGTSTPHFRDQVEDIALRINDVSIDERYFEISWQGAAIEEISYMVVGEV